MQDMNSIVALFKDTADERLWTDHLVGIPELLRAIVGENLLLSLDNLRRISINPRLVLLSSRLYPMENPQLVTAVRTFFPNAELLLVASSTDDSPPLLPLLADNIRHLVINSSRCGKVGEATSHDCIGTAVRKLVAAQPWKIGECLRDGTPIHEYLVSSSEQKEELISSLQSVIWGEAPDVETIRQRGALLADEMLENAMYGAPRGGDGGKLFRKSEKRGMLPQEKIVFRFGFDGETLALEMADSWGSLVPNLVMEYLVRNQENIGLPDETGGRGLFIIWRFLDHFHVNITPGRQTIIGGHVRVTSPLPPEAPRGFHITTTDKEMKNECTFTDFPR